MRKIGGLWVWEDLQAHRLMIGNEAAAQAYKPEPAAITKDEPAVDVQLPDVFVSLGVYKLQDGPAMAFRVAIDPGIEPWPGMLAGVLGGLLAPLAAGGPADIRVDYVNGPSGRALFRDGALVASGPVQGLDGAEEFNLAFDLLRLLLGDKPMMSVLHGSAVRWQGHNIVFMGQSGSGKSTIAALLVAAGGTYLSDDHVALNRSGYGVHPLPMAPSIKEGAWPVVAPHFPALMDAPVFHKGPEPFRLMPGAPMVQGVDAGPVDLLVFPQFSAEEAPKSVVLTPIEVLLKLSRAGLHVERGQGEGLIDWAVQTPALALRHTPDFEATKAALSAALTSQA